MRLYENTLNQARFSKPHSLLLVVRFYNTQRFIAEVDFARVSQPFHIGAVIIAATSPAPSTTNWPLSLIVNG